jgi:hypothetical protein
MAFVGECDGIRAPLGCWGGERSAPEAVGANQPSVIVRDRAEGPADRGRGIGELQDELD